MMQGDHRKAPLRSFRKSTFSGDSGCVEVDFAEDGIVLVRDSKAPEGPCLSFTKMEWAAFLKGVRQGEFNI